MIYVGIDVAKNEHDCFITNSEGGDLSGVFTISNTLEGFDELLSRIRSAAMGDGNIKVGLESTGHYSDNIRNYLLDKGLTTFVINPLLTSLFRNCHSLRKTKTDSVDARVITMMLRSGMDIKSYQPKAYHNDELKSLTRFRSRLVKERSVHKTSVSRLVTILFPELEHMVSTIHSASVYALLSKFPSAQHIANAHLKSLTVLLHSASRGAWGRDRAIEIRDAARRSIGSGPLAASIELQATISIISMLDRNIDDLDAQIGKLMEKTGSPILSIPGMGLSMGAAIIAEIGDFSRFPSADKLLAFAGMSPTRSQSGESESSHARMEKRGSSYLRCALFNAAIYVCKWVPEFNRYLCSKLAEGKHYYVAVSHTAKKLLRMIYAMEKSGEAYRSDTRSCPVTASTAL